MAVAVAVAKNQYVNILSQKQESTSKTLPGLLFKPEGYNYWKWRGHKVHYVVQGKGSPLVLVHGFGASVYHWRYNIPELAKKHEVYALDLLGFGWSEKALVEYDPLLWSNQIADFIEQVVQKPAVLVGNSIGGLISLKAAAEYPESIPALALVNPAGIFSNEKRREKRIYLESSNLEYSNSYSEYSMLKKLSDWAKREILLFAFRQITKRSRIRATLNRVYKDKSNVDDFLLNSILEPAADPNAAEAFYRMMSRFLFEPSDISLNKLLADLACPLLVLWGIFDPMARISRTDKIEALHNPTKLVKLEAGHCPHDEVPQLVNKELTSWISSVNLW